MFFETGRKKKFIASLFQFQYLTSDTWINTTSGFRSDANFCAKLSIMQDTCGKDVVLFELLFMEL